MVKYFTIYGERCSGTNFIERAIVKNFNIELTWKYDFKHFFGFHEFNENDKYDDVLFIGIIRSPYEWLSSLYEARHHLPQSVIQNWESYINNEFYSIREDTGKEIMEDRNMINKKRYKNIFDLRYTKNNFLINIMKNKVKNYILLRYEDFNNNYELSMKFMEEKYKLKRKNKDLVFINNYKGYGGKKYIKKKYIIPEHIKDKIKKKLNKEQEKSLGYNV